MKAILLWIAVMPVFYSIVFMMPTVVKQVQKYTKKR